MSKVNPYYRSKSGSTKRIPTTVLVHRTAERGGTAFEACVRMGKKLKDAREHECAYGKNPRVAISKAMTNLGKHLKTRGGAFRGYRKSKR